MSTIKSSAENLTLNADGANNDIKFQSNGSEVAAIDQAGNLTVSGTVDGVDIQTLNTTAGAALPKAGGTMTGQLNLNSNLDMGDNHYIAIGASDDFQIYHDGNNSYVKDTGTGDLLIRGSNNLKLQSATGEDMVVATTNDAVNLYFDNTLKLATTNTGINVTGVTNTGGLYNTTPTSTTATGWNFNNGGATVTCTQNTAVKIGDCGASGMLIINDTSLNGQINILLTGAGSFTFLGASSHFVNSSSPNTSQVGFYRDGSQIYVKNGKSSTVQLGLLTFRTRNAQ